MLGDIIFAFSDKETEIYGYKGLHTVRISCGLLALPVTQN